MNLFRSEEHARVWEAQHVGLQGEILPLERALALGHLYRQRPAPVDVHPSAGDRGVRSAYAVAGPDGGMVATEVIVERCGGECGPHAVILGEPT
jgi:hypothetical protein